MIDPLDSFSADGIKEVRLFPLADLVFFPGNIQPLHIFESRYCEMLEDALSTDRLITMATLKPGYESEYYGRPELAEAVCVGRIEQCEKTDEGTYNLLLIGLHRAVIEEELPATRSFRQARVLLMGDDEDDRPHHRSLARSVVGRIQRLAPSSTSMLDTLLESDLSLGQLTDVLAFHTNLSTEAKLRLLGERDVTTRAELLLEALPGARLLDDSLPRFSEN